ncbi:MAG TPA: acyl-CoA dehydrogenase family protein [Solirubrobacteraceae bacterium]|nr:acyl-CoA dehydrogenase family protein [Solirubrobacteraceae bacterium]
MVVLDSADRVAWREANRGFIARGYPIEQTRARLEQRVSLDRRRWAEACEMGWIAALVSPEHGGLGAGPELFADLCEEIGRGLVGDPVAGCALSASVIAEDPALAAQSLLGELIEGSACCAWCVAEDDRTPSAKAISLELELDGDGLVINGSKTYVLDADVADYLLVSARCDGSLRSVVVAADDTGVRITPARGLDLTRSVCRVDFDRVQVTPPAAEWDRSASAVAITRGLLLGGLLVCSDAIGAAERLMEMTVAYALQREVFGRTLASYQAVKHKCADMLCGIEGSRVAAVEAARALGATAGQDGEALAAAARSVHVLGSFAGESCSRTAGDALQLHGGIGFTWEHDLHLYLRRVKADQALFGTVDSHREALGRMTVDDALAAG